MIFDDYRCPEHGVFELKRASMEDTAMRLCPTCSAEMTKVFHYPYTKMMWHAPDRSRTGSDRMVIRSARHGVESGALSDGSDTLQTNLGLTR